MNKYVNFACIFAIVFKNVLYFSFCEKTNHDIEDNIF